MRWGVQKLVWKMALTKQYVMGKNADYSFNNKESALLIKFLLYFNKDNKINLHLQIK